MKRIALALVLTLSLGGCAGVQQALTGVSLATASIANPVTPERLDAAEQGMLAAFKILNAYKRACIRTPVLNCRQIIKEMQYYTRQMPPALTQVRGFVDSGQQVNAINAYNLFMGLWNGFKETAAKNNIVVGG